MSYDLDISGVYIHEGEQVSCPSCTHFHQPVQVGTLELDGTVKKTVFRCTSCSNVFTTETPGVQNLIDTTKSITGAENVSFSPEMDITISDGTTVNSAIGALDVNIDNTTNEIVNGFQKLNQTVMNGNNDLEWKLDELITELKNIVERNRILQEKVSNPLNGLRQLVNEFNLE